MTSILSVYYSPWHWYPQDEDYMRRLDPAWVRIHQPTARAINLVHRAAPNARIMLRSWNIDDENGQRKQEMYADPKGAARKHLEMWKVKWDELLDELHRNDWQFNEGNWYIGLVNEPDPAYVPQTVAYTLEAMRLVQGTSIRLGVVASSVGTYSKPSENDQGWTKFMPLEKPINDGGHILIAHEYWQPEGPRFGEDAGNLAWRHHVIPLDVPILIGESGANGFIYGRHSEKDDSGWQKTVADPKPETFAAQVKEYIEGCDKRVKGVCLYMLDFHSDQWWSFNTGPASAQLLAIKDARPQVPSPFASTPISPQPPTPPVPVTPAQPPYVPAPSEVLPKFLQGTVTALLLNVRSGPATDYPIVRQLAQGATVTVTARAGRAASMWLQVGKSEWIYERYVALQDEPVVQPDDGPTPAPPSGDKWARSMAFIERWEGEYQNTPADKGNWTGCETGKGINKGTKYGISACSYPDLDIVNLRREEAREIFRRDYWAKSGADKLAWPACLLVMDTAVLHGVGAAKAWLAEVGPNPYAFAAKRLRVYTKSDNGDTFWRGWVNRVSDLLEEIGKP